MAENDAPDGAPADAPGGEGTGLPVDAAAVIPLRNIVLFPGVVLPIAVRGTAAVAAAQEAVRRQAQVVVTLQRNPEVAEPGPDDLHRVGVIANIVRYLTAPDGSHHLILQGEARFRILDFIPNMPFLVVRGQRLTEPDTVTGTTEARFIHLREQALESLRLLPQSTPQMTEAIQAIDAPGTLADVTAAYMDIKPEEKQEILETLDLERRIEKVTQILGHRLEVLRLSHEISQQTKVALDEKQREVLLREQMAAIQRQLGEEDGKAAEMAEIGEAITKAKMPEEVEKQARKELRRLEKMPEASPETGMIRNYLDWLTELPWSLPDEQPIDLAEARKVLDDDHYGLENIKQRIVEYLAIRKLAPEGRAPILCFVGPPGVGKTSLGQSIARAMNRKFVRVSLGGVHDEAEIRGHRRTYIGALPGNIIQAIRKAGERNCVMMLDEIDKLGRGIQGDPSAAMLEVLDPEQNGTFRDNYLGVPFDLSRVVFITTANMLETIPGPLRDRMEVISLAGYTDEEKLQIARRYLVRRQMEANGLKEAQAEIDDQALMTIIRQYTREAGVRTLEREIGRALRHVAVSVAEGSATTVHIGAGDLPEILGPPRFENEIAMRTSVPGVATGLAWTPVGGDILFIEAARSPGTGRLILTGQLGDVMRESAQAGLTIVKQKAAALGIDPQIFEKSDIHVHVPAGATPKDGPSAGVAMVTALTSLLTGRTVRHDTAMTGEISLRGLVLPVGGIKEKVVAAAGAGLKRVLLPARNRRDYEEIPESARDQLEFVWLETVDDALAAALEGGEGNASASGEAPRGTGEARPLAASERARAE